ESFPIGNWHQYRNDGLVWIRRHVKRQTWSATPFGPWPWFPSELLFAPRGLRNLSAPDSCALLWINGSIAWFDGVPRHSRTSKSSRNAPGQDDSDDLTRIVE